MRKGTKHSEETKAKIAAAKLGKTFTPEHSAKISAALKGQKKSVAHCNAISKGTKLAHINRVRIALGLALDLAVPGTDVTVIDIVDKNGNSIEAVS
jgi:hypothetical protein